MKNFCEDFEDGYEPPEADEEWWSKLEEKWDEVDHIVEPPLPQQPSKSPDDDIVMCVIELGSLFVIVVM